MVVENLAALSTSVVVSGLLTVFLALVILIAAVSIMGALLGKGKKKQKTNTPAAPAPSVPAAPTPPPAQQIVQSDDDETVAVITAAIASVMDAQAPGVPYAVTGIRRAQSGRPVWGFAGMQQNTRPF